MHGKSLQLCLTLCDPVDHSPPGSSVTGDSPGKNTGVGCHALLQGNLPNPGIESRSPALQEDSLPSEPPGKPIHIFKSSKKIAPRRPVHIQPVSVALPPGKEILSSKQDQHWHSRKRGILIYIFHTDILYF